MKPFLALIMLAGAMGFFAAGSIFFRLERTPALRFGLIAVNGICGISMLLLAADLTDFQKLSKPVWITLQFSYAAIGISAGLYALGVIRNGR